MKLQIQITTLVQHATYWLEFDTVGEQSAAMTFLDGLTSWGNDRKGEGRMPLYLIEDQGQQDALDRFLRELSRAGSPGVAASPSDR